MIKNHQLLLILNFSQKRTSLKQANQQQVGVWKGILGIQDFTKKRWGRDSGFDWFGAYKFRFDRLEWEIKRIILLEIQFSETKRLPLDWYSTFPTLKAIGKEWRFPLVRHLDFQSSRRARTHVINITQSLPKRIVFLAKW